jgi:4-hydroxy-3-methylbut-2-enyl diphosphate reductase
MRIIPIFPRGFCAGVERALKIAEGALKSGETVYCIHEIVHNETVVRSLENKGMRFVETVDEVPIGAKVLFSAHGTSPAVRKLAEERNLRTVDATCPFVAKVHDIIKLNFAQGLRTAVIGNPSHAEVIGYLGEPGACLPEDVKEGEKTGTVVQTTLDSAEYDNVCTATRDRQRAVENFCGDAVLVLGSAKSSNTQKLVEKALKTGKRAWRVSSKEDLLAIDFSGVEILGVTAGASTPESFFNEIMALLESRMKSS